MILMKSNENNKSLYSSEKLTNSSPSLYEQIPGLSEFVDLKTSNEKYTDVADLLVDMDTDDLRMIQELANMSSGDLNKKIKEIQNISYQLGLEEEKEISRGIVLNVLEKKQD